MMAGKSPPSPEDIPAMLTEAFVDNNILKINSVKAIRDIYSVHKSISHGDVSHIKGAEIDSWHDTAEKFLNDLVNKYKA